MTRVCDERQTVRRAAPHRAYHSCNNLRTHTHRGAAASGGRGATIGTIQRTLQALGLPRFGAMRNQALNTFQTIRSLQVKGSVHAAVDPAGKHLAKELAPRRVNVIGPGVTDEAQRGEAGSAKRQATLERISAALPVKRVATPKEVASAYLFVMTNPFVTGAVVDVDGGGLL